MTLAFGNGTEHCNTGGHDLDSSAAPLTRTSFQPLLELLLELLLLTVAVRVGRRGKRLLTIIPHIRCLMLHSSAFARRRGTRLGSHNGYMLCLYVCVVLQLLLWKPTKPSSKPQTMAIIGHRRDTQIIRKPCMHF